MYSVRLSDLYPVLIIGTWRLIPHGERAVGDGRRGACRVFCEATFYELCGYREYDSTVIGSDNRDSYERCHLRCDMTPRVLCYAVHVLTFTVSTNDCTH
jgi:hypothetical protein